MDNMNEMDEMDEIETNEPNSFTPAEIAQLLNIDAKALRRFIRSDNSPISPCGKGNSYKIGQSDAKALIAAFRAKGATKGAKRPMRSIEELSELLS